MKQDEKKMKYILINDLYVAGGTEVQSIRELDYFLQSGHEVLYITFDPKLKYHESKHKNHINLCKRGKFIDRFICNKKTYNELRKIIIDFKPDFIHLNNTYLSAPAIYKAVQGFYCIQTIRDYAYVCPKSTCILKDYSICQGMKHKNCVKNCMPYKPKEFLKFFAKYIALKQNRKFQKKSVDIFLSPSQRLTDYCNNHEYNTKCVNNSFDFNIVNEFKKVNNNEKKIYLFYGMVAEIKGVTKLIEAFKNFAEDKKDVELHIVGRLKEMTIKDLKCDDVVKYFGPLPYEKMLEKLQTVYSVIVPSLWIENYPNTVLEGFATDCIVLASNRGGMTEQIENKNCIFDVMSNKDIVRVLNYSYNLDEKDKQILLKQQHNYLETHNKQEDYYNNVLKVIEEGKVKYNEKNTI